MARQKEADSEGKPFVEAHQINNIDMTLASLLEDIQTVLCFALQTKPADNECWRALGRIDATRRALQRQAGSEATEFRDPRKRVHYREKDQEES